MWAKIRGWLRLAVKEYNSLIYFLKISKLVPVNTFLPNLYNLKWRFQGSSQPRHTNNLPFPYFDWWIRLKTVSTDVLTDIHIFLPSFFIFLVLDTQVMTDRPLSTRGKTWWIFQRSPRLKLTRPQGILWCKLCIFWICSPLSYLEKLNYNIKIIFCQSWLRNFPVFQFRIFLI